MISSTEATVGDLRTILSGGCTQALTVRTLRELLFDVNDQDMTLEQLDTYLRA